VGLAITAQQWSPAVLSVTVDSILVQDKKLATADVEGRVVVLSLRAGAYFDFNRIATEIWCMLAEPCRVGKIFDCLSRRHDVDEETLARDVTPFLQILVEQQLVRMVAREEMQ
jgi:Coenzyme PQQ synthesis protein D (PqqD)